MWGCNRMLRVSAGSLSSSLVHLSAYFWKPLHPLAGPAPHSAGCLHPQIPKVYTHHAATALFFFFGLKTLWDAYKHVEVSCQHLASSDNMTFLADCAVGLPYCNR